MRYVIDIFLLLGVFIAFAGVVGVLRMPDVFCRMQSATNITTLGVVCTAIGGAIYAFFGIGEPAMAIKIIVIGLFYLLTSPISGHALAKGAYRHGIRPVKELACDKYGEDLEND